jgi:hypothetical protein
MRQLRIYVPASDTVEIGARGDYVRLKTGSVSLRIEDPDREHWLELSEGDSVNLKQFDRLKLTHSDATGQYFTLLIGNGTSSDSARIGGAMTAIPTTTGGAAHHAQVTVTSASGVLLAANSARRYLLVQNRSLTGSIWINLNGIAATKANGIRIEPGGFYESNTAWVSTAQIRAIGDIASNPDILVIEGD